MSDPAILSENLRASIEAYTPFVQEYQKYNLTKVAALADKFISLVGSGRVLDAGCGPGRDLVRFANAGFETVGVDLNEEFVRLSRRNTQNLNVSVLRANLCHLPFASGSFDGLWACASLVHLQDEEASRALGEFARVTKPSSIVYSSVKISGPAGWSDTPHGRRWFKVWNPENYLNMVQDNSMEVLDFTCGEVFIDVWARTNGNFSRS